MKKNKTKTLTLSNKIDLLTSDFNALIKYLDKQTKERDQLTKIISKMCNNDQNLEMNEVVNAVVVLMRHFKQ